MKYVQFTKRTNLPKLAYIIDTLTKRGVPCRLKGESMHAPILWVSENFQDDAWALLSESAKSHGIKAAKDSDLDDVADDHPFFKRFEAALPPAEDESSEEAEWYAELERGYAQDRI